MSTICAMMPVGQRKMTVMSSSRSVWGPSVVIYKWHWVYPKVSKVSCNPTSFIKLTLQSIFFWDQTLYPYLISQPVNQQWLCSLILWCTWDVSHTWIAKDHPAFATMRRRLICEQFMCLCWALIVLVSGYCNTICYFTLYAFIAMAWLTVYFVITDFFFLNISIYILMCLIYTLHLI